MVSGYIAEASETGLCKFPKLWLYIDRTKQM